MARSVEPVSGFAYGWDPITENFSSDMDAFLLEVGATLRLSVLDRGVTDPSTLTPSDGDRHIVAAGATGTWAGKDDAVAVWRSALSAWEFYTPKKGWLCFIENEEVLSAFKATGWSPGVAI